MLSLLAGGGGPSIDEFVEKTATASPTPVIEAVKEVVTKPGLTWLVWVLIALVFVGLVWLVVRWFRKQ